MSYIYDHTVNDILTAAEVAEFLSITKQRLSVLVSEKRIHYKRQKNGALIFMRQDIEEYKNKETYKSIKLKDLVGITSRSLDLLVPGDFNHSVTGEKSQKVTRGNDQKSHLTPPNYSIS